MIPEQIAVQKLYLHQAKLDTIEAPEAQVAAGVDKRLNFFIANLGSKEKVEEYFNKPLPQLREQLMDVMRTSLHYGSGAEPAHKKCERDSQRGKEVFRRSSGRQHPVHPDAG